MDWMNKKYIYKIDEDRLIILYAHILGLPQNASLYLCLFSFKF